MGFPLGIFIASTWEFFSNQKYLKLRGVCVSRRPWNIPLRRGSSCRHECVAEHQEGQEIRPPSDFARMSLHQASKSQYQTWRQKWFALVCTFPASSEAVGNRGILQLSLKCHVRDCYGFLSRSAGKDFKCRPDWIPISSCLESVLMKYSVNSEPETHWARHGVCFLNRGSGRWSSL